MSESFIDRFLVDLSHDSDGPLTRSLAEASTSGIIRNDPPHWSIERYIPLEVAALVEYLVGRGELTASQQARLGEFHRDVDSILHEQMAGYHTRFAQAYASLDPDCDSRQPQAADPPTAAEPAITAAGPWGLQTETTQSASAVAEVIELCEEVLQLAGYRRISQEDVEQCAGVASQWGVPLHVDFNLFSQLVVFARGDIVGTRPKRRLRNLYRREIFEVPIYQRMVVLFQLRSDHKSDEKLTATALHLRMFKNIPKQDIDMLLPGTRVRITGIDRVKIIIPSLGGFLIAARKVALYTKYLLLFAAIALHWTAIVVALVIGYIVKSVMSYFQTKKHYELNLTRNLYFQKLDTNAGVACRMMDQAHRQSAVEMILAYYALLISDEPLSSRKLRRRCERIVREAIDVEVDFQAEITLARLLEIGAVQEQNGQWQSLRR